MNLNHLHGDTNEEKEIKLEQTDDNLVPSVHCYRGVGSDPVEVRWEGFTLHGGVRADDVEDGPAVRGRI